MRVRRVVFGRLEPDALQAVDVAALADDRERLVVSLLGTNTFLDALVHIAKERFVHRQPFFSRGHSVGSLPIQSRGESSRSWS